MSGEGERHGAAGNVLAGAEGLNRRIHETQMPHVADGRRLDALELRDQRVRQSGGISPME